MNAPTVPKVLTISTDPHCKAALEAFTGKVDFIELVMDLEALLQLSYDPPPPVVICGASTDARVELVEVAQLLRTQFPAAAVFYVTPARVGFERNSFKKNGFTDAFLLPWDKAIFAEAVREKLGISIKADQAYKTVKLVDIQAGSMLDFNTYVHLPMNNKHVRFSSAGDPIDAQRAERLAKSQISALHVELKEMPKFYEYTARKLHEMGKDGAISETERQQKMKHVVRELIGGIFSADLKESTLESGRADVIDCQQIVTSYIGQLDEKQNWFGKLINLAGNQSTTYDHAANVATFAALFSLGLGIGKPEDLAIAGVLHDIGLSDLPIVIQQKKESEFAPEELRMHMTHPERSLAMIRQRKLIVPATTLKAIAQHHEKWNGTGFPRGLAKKRICPEAQVLAIADVFDEMTTFKDGQTRYSPADALKKIKELNTTDESRMSFDPTLVDSLVGLFLSGT